MSIFDVIIVGSIISLATSVLKLAYMIGKYQGYKQCEKGEKLS